jgi:hypothetical protein
VRLRKGGQGGVRRAEREEGREICRAGGEEEERGAAGLKEG